ncbi:MAG: hypothetical protein L3J17_08565 [Candidatus Jettenia sp.]|nr:MAG: hypothetical protein L3J17_08565 [Candidatus Jettenia sp.]
MSKIKKNINEFFNNGSEIDKALQSAVKEALLKHKIAGNPIASWKDDKVIWIQPKDIPVEDSK